ncbi:MAG TPA: VOC family protein [Candidatus Tumulicola sp.]|nr:VOC family protein [Candidatus Tumulicola sp.]
MLHHVDVHVRDLAAARALFDAIAPHVGYRTCNDDPDFAGYERADGGRPRVGLILDPADVRAGSIRVAFSVASRDEVDAAAAAAERSGARAIEGPGLHPEYGDDYYAVFFEDADGNRYEIVNA